MVLDQMDPGIRNALLQRSPRPRASADAEATSLWICSWLKTSNMEAAANVQNRRDLALVCESTRARLQVLLAAMEAGPMLAVRAPAGADHARPTPVEHYLDVNGTEFVGSRWNARFTPIQQLVLIVGFCLAALYFSA